MSEPQSPLTWPLKNLGITCAAENGSGMGVKIAVLDTGIDLDHRDFRGRFQEGINARSFVAGESVQDTHGHGTHCTGIIASPLLSSGGKRYGVAPHADLLIAKVVGRDGTGRDRDIVDAMCWAVEQGARIISMSVARPRSADEAPMALYEQIAASMYDHTQGALLVVASGNESARPDYVRPLANPAVCESILAVAAVDEENEIGWFSSGGEPIGDGYCDDYCDGHDHNYKTGPDMSAPGQDIYSAWRDDVYRTVSGSSMGTPHVAGIAALYLERDPSLTPRQLRAKLAESCLKLGDAYDFGTGIVQAPKRLPQE